MARRSFCSISQAVLYEPRPSYAWSCKAEMPFEWLARSARSESDFHQDRYCLKIIPVI